MTVISPEKFPDDPRLVTLMTHANRCSLLRNKSLVVDVCARNPEGETLVESAQITISLNRSPDDPDFVHHLAHEYAHVIAGCCGFSLDPNASSLFYEDDCNPDREEKSMAAREVLQPVVNCYTHIAVHTLLRQAGFEGRNWDNYLIKKIAKTKKVSLFTEMKVRLAIYIIQYELLQELELPGLDVAELRRVTKDLYPDIDQYVDQLRVDTSEANLLDPSECLAVSRQLLTKVESTLWKVPLSEYFDLSLGCTTWNLDEILDSDFAD